MQVVLLAMAFMEEITDLRMLVHSVPVFAQHVKSIFHYVVLPEFCSLQGQWSSCVINVSAIMSVHLTHEIEIFLDVIGRNDRIHK